MRVSISRFSILVAVLVALAVVPATTMYAKGSGALAAPSLTVTGPGCDGSNPTFYCLDWSCVPGAVNYAIEAVAIYCTPPLSTGPLTVEFEFNSTSCDASYPGTPNFEVDGATFNICDPLDSTCASTSPMTPDSVSFHVKGLAVPKGPQGRQNNPFSDWSPAAPDPTICIPPPPPA
jgi:hypothetical protein